MCNCIVVLFSLGNDFYHVQCYLKRNYGSQIVVNDANMSNYSDQSAPNAEPQSTDSGPNVISPTITSGTSGTTKFADDADGVVSRPDNPSNLLGSIRSIVQVEGAEDIIQFLQKPTRITTAAMSTTDTGAIQTLDIWQLLISDIVKTRKLAGVMMMRADLRVRLNVNATRFQMGRYILAHVPSGGLPTSNLSYLAMSRAHRANLTTQTTLPHVEIDLSTQSHVELVVPFRSAYPMHTVYTAEPWSDMGIGVFYLYPYVPLFAGSGNGTCPFTIWANFENVELSMPAINHGYAVAENQGGSPTDVEQLSKNGGPVTSFVAKVSMASRHLTSVPLLGPIMQQVAWTAGHVAKSVNVFGFSKPLNVSMPTQMYRNVIPLAANSDTFSTAQPLSLLASNETVLNSGVQGTNEDEMDVTLIAKRYANIWVIPWTTAMTADTTLVSIPIQISAYTQAFGLGVTYVPLSMMALFFRYWRGSVKFRIKIVKTDFHSGRLIIGYSPRYRGTNTTGMMDTESSYLYRQVVDVREVNEMEFCIPYISPDLYSDVSCQLGNFTITVQDGLLAPNTVSGTVYLCIEVAGGDDIEFAYPVSPSMNAYVPAVVQSGYTSVPCFELGPKSSVLTTDPSSVAIGELVRSLRQLAKRYTFSPNAATPTAANDVFFYYPFLNVANTQTGTNTSAILKDATSTGDLLSLLSPMYLFSSGGLRTFILPVDTNAAVTHYFVGMDQVPLDAPTTVAKYSATWNSWESIRTAVNPALNSIIDVQVPSYTRTIARINAAQLVNSADSRLAPSSSVGSNVTYVSVDSRLSSYNSPRKFYAMRALADDGTLSGWYGTVPLIARIVA